MREHKYRAWDIEKQVWILNPTVDFKRQRFELGRSNNETHDGVEITVVQYGDIKYLSQYTGLLDKNGKEIYFGDICRVDWNDKRYPIHNVEISWNEEECSIDIEGGSPKRDCENHYEIIGNIYENPDLLVDGKVLK